MSFKNLLSSLAFAAATIGGNVNAMPQSQKIMQWVSDDAIRCVEKQNWKLIATASEWVVGCKTNDGEVRYFDEGKKETGISNTETELDPQVISPKTSDKK